MVLFGEWLLTVVLSALGLICSLQDDTPVCLHECLEVNGTSTFILYIPPRHDC